MDKYYKIVEYNACIDIAQFKAELYELKPETELKLEKMKVKGRGYSLELNPTLKMDSDENITLTLVWNDNVELKQTIQIEIVQIETKRTRANRKGYKSFFKRNDKRYKKLYYIETCFKGKNEFGGYNLCTCKSKLDRIKLILAKGNPERKRGQRWHQGKLTPYGKQCLRYEMAQMEMIKFLYGELTQTQKDTLDLTKKALKKIDESLNKHKNKRKSK